MDSHTNITNELTINSFKAINHPELCENFSTGHANVLKDFGVKKVTSANKSWQHNPNSYVISVQMNNSINFVAGARIDIKAGTFPLPIEEAIGIIDSSIHPLVENYSKNKTGEVCGLWTSKESAGNGIAFFMIKSSIVLAKLLNLDSVFALCSPYTVSMFSKLGFEIEKSLGNDGTFYYPKIDLIATAMIMKNIKNFNCVCPDYKDFMNRLANSPRQQIIESGTKGLVAINYDFKTSLYENQKDIT